MIFNILSGGRLTWKQANEQGYAMLEQLNPAPNADNNSNGNGESLKSKINKRDVNSRLTSVQFSLSVSAASISSNSLSLSTAASSSVSTACAPRLNGR